MCSIPRCCQTLWLTADPEESCTLLIETNRPFPSSLVPLFQSESKCETILMKMTLICRKKTLHAELIFIWKVSHLDSLWNRGTRELGNGLYSFFCLDKLLVSVSLTKHYLDFADPQKWFLILKTQMVDKKSWVRSVQSSLCSLRTTRTGKR